MQIEQNVTISDRVADRHPSSILDISSAKRGVLLPRGTTGSYINMMTPAEGLLFYDSLFHSYMFFNGDEWKRLTPEVYTPPTNYVLGVEAYGGIIFYLTKGAEDLNGDDIPDRGLIMYDSDITRSFFAGGGFQTNRTFHWGCNEDEITGATGQHIGDGYRNSDYIVSNCSESNSAASLCTSLIANDYSDWHLPSLGELKYMYAFMKQNGCKNGEENCDSSMGNISNNKYWTSSKILVRDLGVPQPPNISSYHMDMATGQYASSDRSEKYRVRPVRVF